MKFNYKITVAISLLLASSQVQGIHHAKTTPQDSEDLPSFDSFVQSLEHAQLMESNMRKTGKHSAVLAVGGHGQG